MMNYLINKFGTLRYIFGGREYARNVDNMKDVYKVDNVKDVKINVPKKYRITYNSRLGRFGYFEKDI